MATKRAAERQLTKDEAERENTELGEGEGAQEAGVGFARAPPEALAKRRIVRARRRTPSATSAAATATTAAAAAATTTTAAATGGETNKPSVFAGLSFAPAAPVDPAAAFAGISFAAPVAKDDKNPVSATNVGPEDNKEAKPDEKVAEKEKETELTVSADAKEEKAAPVHAPSGFFFGAPATKPGDEKKDDEIPTSTAPPSTPAGGFLGASTTKPSDEKKDAPASSPTVASGFFGAPSTNATAEKKDEEKKETPTSAPAPASGFFFFSAPPMKPAGEKKDEEKDMLTPTAPLAAATAGGWKCPCCESLNAETDKTCPGCWVPRKK